MARTMKEGALCPEGWLIAMLIATQRRLRRAAVFGVGVVQTGVNKGPLCEREAVGG